tara:strand:+ start:80 stop:475 length:396 start_codon:yes stop_codon:yes gene_type:complete
MSGLGGLFSVLMVGHSLFAADGPDMLQEALRAGLGQGEVRAQIINGAPLRYNWQESDSAEGVDARDALPEGKTTHLILTEAIPLEPHPMVGYRSLCAGVLWPRRRRQSDGEGLSARDVAFAEKRYRRSSGQ